MTHPIPPLAKPPVCAEVIGDDRRCPGCGRRGGWYSWDDGRTRWCDQEGCNFNCVDGWSEYEDDEEEGE